MLETVLILAAAVCIVDVLWMHRAQRRAALATDDTAQNGPSHSALIRRLIYYSAAIAVIYTFGGWLNLGA